LVATTPQKIREFRTGHLLLNRSNEDYDPALSGESIGHWGIVP
jgi:hypothetical protein